MGFDNLTSIVVAAVVRCKKRVQESARRNKKRWLSELLQKAWHERVERARLHKVYSETLTP